MGHVSEAAVHYQRIVMVMSVNLASVVAPLKQVLTVVELAADYVRARPRPFR